MTPKQNKTQKVYAVGTIAIFLVGLTFLFTSHGGSDILVSLAMLMVAIGYAIVGIIRYKRESLKRGLSITFLLVMFVIVALIFAAGYILSHIQFTI